jgi:PEP-CTERM motif
MIKRLALIFLISGALVVAQADNVSLVSSATTTTNSTASPTQNIDTNPLWAGPLAGSSWVSFASTGNPSDSGFVAVPNGTAVTFTDTFSLSGTIQSAYLNVLADDTASVWVNGTELMAANLTGPYPVCAATGIGCLATTEGMFTNSQLAPYLQDGTNTVQFTVYQEGGGPYGLDYSGAVTTTAADPPNDPVRTPEPSSVLLLGVGFSGLALLKLRR